MICQGFGFRVKLGENGSVLRSGSLCSSTLGLLLDG